MKNKRAVYMELKAAQLSVDATYQRKLRQGHVKNIHDTLAWSKFGTLSVSERPDGTYQVYDGWHRKNAAEMLFGPDVKLPCMVMVYDGPSSVMSEARDFCDIQRDRKNISLKEQYRAGMVGEHPDWLAVHNTITGVGRKVFGGSGRFYFTGVGVLIKLARGSGITTKDVSVDGHTLMHIVFMAAHEICGNTMLKDVMVHGTSAIIKACYRAGVDYRPAIERISKQDPEDLLMEAKHAANLKPGIATYRAEIGSVMRKHANKRVRIPANRVPRLTRLSRD